MARYDMFSTTPTTFWPVCSTIWPARSATSADTAWGVVTMTSSESGMSCATEIAMSPVPGGRSRSRTSRSPQKTSARNCSSALCRIGPRQTTAELSGRNMPIEMILTPWATGGMIMLSSWLGGYSTPIMRGMENPKMSASTSPTFIPRAAMEAARLAVTEDLPTPPLPEAIA